MSIDPNLTEDQEVYFKQYVCGKCLNRFTTQDDASVHYAIFHDKQPKASDIMDRIIKVEDLVEQILITISRDDGPNKMPDVPGDPAR